MKKKSSSLLLTASLLINVLGAPTLYNAWVRRAQFPLLSPRIFAQNRNDIIINFTTLRGQIRTFMENTEGMHLGVYFEYLPSGVSIGVHEKDDFISASLIKVPLVMGIMKMIEREKITPTQVITLEESDLDRNFGTLWKRGAGTTLTVKEAIDLTLKESDNTAAKALDKLVSSDPIREVYDALDIPTDWAGPLPVVSPKNYSSVFRCLYLSCFLSYEHSQEILHTLTQSAFNDVGLAAGVDPGVPVSHKIGLFDSAKSNQRVRLDCGIVYIPKRPYILCVLGETEQGKEKQINDFTQQLSDLIYRNISTMPR